MNGQVVPFYIVCDESFSMADRIDDVNSSLRDIHTAIASDPAVSDKVQICIITFSDQAEILVELTYPEDLSAMPGCVANGGSSYSAAFSTLRAAIDNDVARLRSNDIRVMRPFAFFITDGMPADESAWRASHASLTGDSNPYRPHIVSFGVPAADPEIIREIATVVNRYGRKLAYRAVDGGATVRAPAKISSRLFQEIATAQTANSYLSLSSLSDIPGVQDLGVVPD